MEQMAETQTACLVQFFQAVFFAGGFFRLSLSERTTTQPATQPPQSNLISDWNNAKRKQRVEAQYKDITNNQSPFAIKGRTIFDFKWNQNFLAQNFKTGSSAQHLPEVKHEKPVPIWVHLTC